MRTCAAIYRTGKNMIKTISILTRKPEISREEFVRHWTEIHAPLAHAVPGVRRYVLSLIQQEPSRADIPTQAVQADGIAELWYDKVEDWRAAGASPEGKRLHADGATFIGQIKSFVTEEKVIIPRGE